METWEGCESGRLIPSTLEIQDLGANKLVGNLPKEMGNLVNLESLFLGYTKMTGGDCDAGELEEDGFGRKLVGGRDSGEYWGDEEFGDAELAKHRVEWKHSWQSQLV